MQALSVCEFALGVNSGLIIFHVIVRPNKILLYFVVLLLAAVAWLIR